MQEELTGLVKRAQTGDCEAFQRLVEASWDRLVRFARSVVGESDAEDAAQEGLVLAWQRLSGLRHPERFSAWVTRIVFRRCLRQTRREPRPCALDLVSEPGAAGNPEQSLGVWNLLARLAPRQRAVLPLTAVEGMTDTEIAAQLGITAGSVRAHRRRARESVHRLLREGPR